MFMSTFLIIGGAYYKGEGTPIDMDKALACFALAAEQKNMDAIYISIGIYKNRVLIIQSNYIAEIFSNLQSFI